MASIGRAERSVFRRDPADVGRVREAMRQRRLLRIAVALAPLLVWSWVRALTGAPLVPGLPAVDPLYLMAGLFFAAMLVVLLGTQLIAGRSPHITYRPEQLEVGIDDVKGLGPLTEDVTRTLDVFLAGRTFRRDMGGTPRRGLLFEGPPGTGKTFLAKAMAHDAGVPFLFVSATSLQSMYYGATARKIRAYFNALRKAARREGGAIGFIEEIDAIATTRGGVSSSSALGNHPATGSITHRAVVSEGVGGVVNELLIQMQSFDTPTGWQRAWGALVDALNLILPASRQLRRPQIEPVEVLLIAATNRADSLDPALLRPGRFDRRITFDPPDKAGRREIIDFYLHRKAHADDLAAAPRRDQLAGLTQGYTPAMIEQLLDEGLFQALRRGATAMSWADVVAARLLVEVGLGHPVSYTPHEKRLIATHEAGHAVLTWLLAPHRRLEVLTIIKRNSALGMLAHGDPEDVYTRSRSELEALITIAFGGLAAEEQFFGESSTGASSDLAYATTLAASMVGAAGMAGSPISIAAADPGIGGANLVTRVLADGPGRDYLEGAADLVPGAGARGAAGQRRPGRGAAGGTPGQARVGGQRDHRRARGGASRRATLACRGRHISSGLVSHSTGRRRRGRGRARWRSVPSLVASVALGIAVGSGSAALGTAVHLWRVSSGGVSWPVGIALALALVLAVDLTLLVAVPSGAAALGDAAGRALVIVTVLGAGPGGDVVLSGSWPSEVWILFAVLVPAFAGPPLATIAAIRRIKSDRSTAPALTGAGPLMDGALPR